MGEPKYPKFGYQWVAPDPYFAYVTWDFWGVTCGLFSEFSEIYAWTTWGHKGMHFSRPPHESRHEATSREGANGGAWSQSGPPGLAVMVPSRSGGCPEKPMGTEHRSSQMGRPGPVRHAGNARGGHLGVPVRQQLAPWAGVRASGPAVRCGRHRRAGHSSSSWRRDPTSLTPQ